MQSVFNQSHPRMIRLRSQSQRFSFFQALRDVESVADGFPRLGHASSPSQEAVRVSQSPELNCAPTTIESAHREPSGMLRLSQRFFGMYGPAGPLPLHFTELIRNRTRQAHDPILQSFVNLFQHRMATLFYRAWASSRPAIQRDRPWQDRYSAYVGALSGNGLRHAQHRDRWPDEAKWFYTGHLAPIRRNAEGLAAMVSGSVQSPARVKPFQLTWLPIDGSDRTRIARQGCELGVSTVLGRRVPDRQGCFELEVGPLPLEKFQRLMLGTPRRRALEAMVRNHSGLGTQTRLRLVLNREDTPKLQLGSRGQLGRDAWLTTRVPDVDPNQSCRLIAS